jgi:hypothetical protein
VLWTNGHTQILSHEPPPQDEATDENSPRPEFTQPRAEDLSIAHASAKSKVIVMPVRNNTPQQKREP